LQKRILIYVRDDRLASRTGMALWMIPGGQKVNDRLRRRLLAGLTIYRETWHEWTGPLKEHSVCVILSRSLRSLERRGLIKRFGPDHYQTRTTYVALTPAGRRVAESLGT
jgi:hypothetical protein